MANLPSRVTGKSSRRDSRSFESSFAPRVESLSSSRASLLESSHSPRVEFRSSDGTTGYSFQVEPRVGLLKLSIAPRVEPQVTLLESNLARRIDTFIFREASAVFKAQNGPTGPIEQRPRRPTNYFWKKLRKINNFLD